VAVASDRNNPRRELVIRPGHHDSEYLPDLWRYRELFYFLAWRDILVRYKQTAIGAAWAIVKPLLTIGVLSYIFGKLAGMPADGVPYPILVAAAMLPWQFFASSVSDSSNSLLAGSELVAKVYFPRLILPGSSMVVNLIDFAVSCVILVGLFVVYRFVPSPAIVAVPLFLLLAAVTAAGLGLWFAALIVRYRDIRHLVPFLLQLGLFASPVGFSSDVVPADWQLLYALNPMVGVIDGFRWSILGGAHELNLPALAVSVGVAVALLASGLAHFRRVERTFADVI